MKGTDLWTMLVIFGALLLIVDQRSRSDRGLEDLSVREGLILGVAQAVALQPGVSRSGVTMTAARRLGLDRESAARFSFLLAMPIIAGAGALKAVDLLQHGFQGYASQFFWGVIASAVSGFLVIWGLLSYLRRNDYRVFLAYRVGVAVLVFGLIVTGVRSATI